MNCQTIGKTGGKKGNDSSDSNKGSTESTTKSGRSTSIDNDGKTPKRRRHAPVRALGAETPAGYCLPEAQLASGIPVVSAIYDRLTILDSDGNPSPDLAESFTAQRRLRPVDIQGSSRRHLPRRDQAGRPGRGGQHQRLPRHVPDPEAAAVHLHLRQHQGREGRRRHDRPGRRPRSRGWRSPNYFASPRVGIMAKAQLDDTKTL